MSDARDTSGPFPVLIIDENNQDQEAVRGALEPIGARIVACEAIEDGLATFRRERSRIVLLAPRISGRESLEVLQQLLALDPGVDVILFSETYSADLASAAINRGASDYLSLPLDPQHLRDRVVELLKQAEQRRKTLKLENELLSAYQFEGMIGRSPLMLGVFATVRRIAPHFRTVLITGQTGTGKELIAQALHRRSPASKEKFVVCNCSALVDTLAESELFGHVRGAFTGAIQDKSGLFEYADGGTIFLDEVGELPLSIQAKLLRVLQNREIQRVGTVIPRTVDIRVIAATHRDLAAMVRRGEFREDLYYRLAVMEIRVPRLALRREDLPLLMRHFVQKLAVEYGKTIQGLTRRAQLRLSTYFWPGNVRELENVLGNACMMTNGNLIDIADLPEQFQQELPGDAIEDPTLLPLEEVERRHVLRVLQGVGGNKARAAEVLGIGRATMYELLSRMKDKDKVRSESA
jgi:DNA-binding NtrC family response regulator